jgi:hypothetical protein
MDCDDNSMDFASMMIAHIAVQPLLWESEELIQSVSSLANEYQENSGDRYFIEYLDNKAHGHGLALLASVVLWKGRPFFETRENTRVIKAIQDAGASNWRVQRATAIREWTRHVRGVVNDYLDEVEKRELRHERRQISKLRSESEWRELEANTLQNLMDVGALHLMQDSERVVGRQELSVRLKQRASIETRLLRAQSMPLSQGSSCLSANPRTLSAPSVCFSDHVEMIEPAIGKPMEVEAEQRITYW